MQGHGKRVLALHPVSPHLVVICTLGVAGALALKHVDLAVIVALTAAPLITRIPSREGQAPPLEPSEPGIVETEHPRRTYGDAPDDQGI